jgi:hypothetical protein
MPTHDFSQLYERYPRVIEMMPDQFTSHQFILELARQNQMLYVEALYSYRQNLHRGSPAPFLIVHGVLANRLREYPRLIRQVRKNAPSIDIFGEDDTCSEWVKIK